MPGARGSAWSQLAVVAGERRGCTSDVAADLLAIDARYVDAHPGDPAATLTIVVGVEGEDAERLQQLAAECRQRPAEVISQLLRSA